MNEVESVIEYLTRVPTGTTKVDARKLDGALRRAGTSIHSFAEQHGLKIKGNAPLLTASTTYTISKIAKP